ncbi:undecaprenyldiphospho-muramoylpentapeptide beta-N-acetylglucosaminyltransferase [Alkaliphilus peptidifermentans]|uniref:UDP-N-acetylglucosamine--N-acetylmuramyl-(pentapeptide) pyrophosphoryl-undecaprenol N-acetylglucosamine transferase n=1 Tax=Alkaliphilus peptidifermentans DSM 18978 TaxID=1120976 RepID=A0A1G5BEZ6_9FIRM|nr:undecaprenyldiphospho-muramoylpentapeptide beta-N-acetylglucosaminyltransferase [Alkaliphilus peptidifermentans]SCX88681.1 UDP-N-acetylglucosamine-N-acetylmuramylpentapeptide N-acetylglucosamine transferase [Alkaliphilus peptidifermentans DSM 18978]
MKIVISGGGTGGHIYPAIAIANKIKENNSSAEILFIGTREGLESDVVPQAGFKMEYITISYLKRKLSFHNVKTGFKLMKGLWEARRILRVFKPDIVIGTGGFVCGPVLYAATRMGLKTMIHEQNVFPGLTNRILSRYVDRILLSFEDAKKYFKYDNKIIVTGNPIRDDFTRVTEAEAKAIYRSEGNKALVLIVGGSGGSSKLNNAVLSILENTNNFDFQLLWATGKNHYSRVIEAIQNKNILNNHKIIPYINNMPHAIKACDLIVCSAGAITIAEVTAAAKPSILIPKAHTAENHQEYNAEALDKIGAAVMIKENELSAETLLNHINNILNNKKLLESMKKASFTSAKIDAVEQIYREILKLIN